MSRALRQLHVRHHIRSGQAPRVEGGVASGKEAFLQSLEKSAQSAVAKVCGTGPKCDAVRADVQKFLAAQADDVWALIESTRGLREMAKQAASRPFSEVGIGLAQMAEGLEGSRKALLGGAITKLTELAHSRDQRFNHALARSLLVANGLVVTDNYILPIWEQALESVYPPSDQKADQENDPAAFERKASIAAGNAVVVAADAWEEWTAELIDATALTAADILSPQKPKSKAGYLAIGIAIAAALALLL